MGPAPACPSTQLLSPSTPSSTKTKKGTQRLYHLAKTTSSSRPFSAINHALFNNHTHVSQYGKLSSLHLRAHSHSFVYLHLALSLVPQHHWKLANSCNRPTQDYPPDGKSATRTPRTSHTTLTSPRNSHDGSHRQEPIPRSSSPIWPSTTAPPRSPPTLHSTAMPEIAARFAQAICW